MKLVSKISLNGDEREVLNAFTTLLETICSDNGDCSECPIHEACTYHGAFPEALDLLLSQTSTENSYQDEEEDPATYEFEPGRVYWNEMAANP